MFVKRAGERSISSSPRSPSLSLSLSPSHPPLSTDSHPRCLDRRTRRVHYHAPQEGRVGWQVNDAVSVTLVSSPRHPLLSSSRITAPCLSPLTRCLSLSLSLSLRIRSTESRRSGQRPLLRASMCNQSSCTLPPLRHIPEPIAMHPFEVEKPSLGAREAQNHLALRASVRQVTAERGHKSIHHGSGKIRKGRERAKRQTRKLAKTIWTESGMWWGCRCLREEERER